MPIKTVTVSSWNGFESGDVFVEYNSNRLIVVERDVPLVLPTTPGTLIKVQWKDGGSRTVTESDVLLRGHSDGIYDYAWHSENNRWPNDSLLNSITDFEVLYAPEPTNTEGGC